MTFNTMHYKDKPINTDETYILLEEQEKKIARMSCEIVRLKNRLEEAGISYVYDVKGEEP